MKRQELFLIITPFFLSVVIIFGHYLFLVSQNPQAHSKPLITTKLVQSLKESELEPVPPQAPFPDSVVGVMHEIPTSRKQLQELLTLMRSQGANTLLLRVGMTLSPDGNIILPQAAETSEETILRWTKKTVSDAHKAELHTYVALMFVEEPLITDPGKFSNQLKQLIERWANMAQEYHVSFFQPGITLGHPSYLSLSHDKLAIFITEIEHATRELYTGRIGIGICCQPPSLATRGYNQLLLISNSGEPSTAIVNKARQDARRYNVEHIFLLELDTQRLSTIK